MKHSDVEIKPKRYCRVCEAELSRKHLYYCSSACRQSDKQNKKTVYTSLCVICGSEIVSAKRGRILCKKSACRSAYMTELRLTKTDSENEERGNEKYSERYPKWAKHKDYTLQNEIQWILFQGQMAEREGRHERAAELCKEAEYIANNFDTYEEYKEYNIGRHYDSIPRRSSITGTRVLK